MKRSNLILYIYFAFLGMVSAQKTNFAPSKTVTDEYFNTKVVDEYRNIEDLKDPSTIKWMKDQTKYSLSVLHSIPNREYYINKRLEFDKRKSFSVSNINITENDFYFYLKQKPGENTVKVFFRKKFSGDEKEVF